MVKTINNVIDDLVLYLKKYELSDATICNYINAYRSLINHCNRIGGELYTDQIPNEFLNKATDLFEKKLHSYYRYSFFKRAVQLLDTFARTGEPDLSHGSSKKYAPSIEHQDIIKNILDENRLVNDAWIEMDRKLRHFFCFLEEESIKLSDLDDSILFRFIEAASATNQATMSLVARAMKLLSEYVKKHKIAELKMDFSMIKLKSAPARMILPFSRDELNRMLECIDLKTPLGIRDKAILLLAIETGLRAIDMIKLQLSNIDWKNAEMCVIQSKTKKSLSLPLNGAVLNAVADYILKVRPESDFHEIFLSSTPPYKPFKCSNALSKRVDRYCLLAEIEKKPHRSFHSLRRSFATELSAVGIPLPTISQMLGHKGIKQVRPYLSYNREQILFCAIGFNGIPINGGIYTDISTMSLFPSGGDDK